MIAYAGEFFIRGIRNELEVFLQLAFWNVAKIIGVFGKHVQEMRAFGLHDFCTFFGGFCFHCFKKFVLTLGSDFQRLPFYDAVYLNKMPICMLKNDGDLSFPSPIKW